MTPVALLEPTPIEDATRREFIHGVGAAALAAAFLAACGPDESDDTGMFMTREFIDSTGAAVQVPVRPQRIVAVHDFNAGAQILALGAPLIGMSTRDGGFSEDVSHFYDRVHVEPVGDRSAIDLEHYSTSVTCATDRHALEPLLECARRRPPEGAGS